MGPKDLLHYRIIDELGQGAMGQVYRAVDQKLGRQVALKVLPAAMASDPGWQARMLREARAASQLNHPGIVTLHDIESADGTTFLVMELVQGERLRDLARKGLTWRRALEIGAGVADALGAAHALGVLHRDIKSDNLMVTRSGQPKVLDFGLAKLRDAGVTAPAFAMSTVTSPSQSADDTLPATLETAETVAPMSPGTEATVRPDQQRTVASALPSNSGSDSGVTQAGQLVGTPAYMAPECYIGVADVRSEVFALGVVLYELLAGSRPFDRDTARETMVSIQRDEPAPPSRVAPDRDIPDEVDEIVLRALAKQPDDRFAGMPELAAALRHALRAPPRRRWVMALAIVALAALAGASGLWLAGSRGDRVQIAVDATRRLTLDPGCEEYPHFLPDGRHVVYDGIIDGDYELLELDITTDQRRRLTDAKGWDYGSSVSPDGELVAYVHEDGDVRVVRVLALAGGTPRDIGPSVGYPAWSADGTLLYGDGTGRILSRDLATNTDRELGHLPAGARLYHLAEVRGAGIALLWWTAGDTDSTTLGELDLAGRLRIVEENVNAYEGGLTAARTRRGYYATRKGATEDNQLLYRPWNGGMTVVVPKGTSPAAGADVARDGKRLVFSTCRERVRVARLAGTGEPVSISGGSWQDTSPVALDRRWLFVTSDRRGPMQGWRIDLETKESPRQVTPARGLQTAPAPDGRSVVYVAEGGRGGLAIIPVDGGEPRTLTRDPSDAAPMFSRDGAHVVFQRSRDGTWTIQVIAVATGAIRQLVEGVQPAPSPVDDTIAFVTSPDAQGARTVMIADLGGGVPRPVPGLPAAAWQWPRFASDGKRLVLVRGYQDVVIVTLDGSVPPATVWKAGVDSASVATFRGDDVLVTVSSYEGDLWLADGLFP